MRGGAGRGGRGGRGGRFGRGSVTQDLVRDNLEDLGIDSWQVPGDRKPPPLYPSISIQEPPKLTDDDLFCIQKMREINSR